MIEISMLDHQIHSLSEWILIAGKSVMSFYNPKQGVFWRDTFGIKAKDEKLHPTSTNRCFFALYEYIRFLEEEDLQKQGSYTEAREILKGVVDRYLSLIATDKDKARKSSTNGENMFTDGLLLRSVSILDSIQNLGIGLDPGLIARIKEGADSIADNTLGKLEGWRGGRVHKDDEVHDFVTLHALRGLDACFGPQHGELGKLGERLPERIKKDVLHLLAYRFAELYAKFDPAELIFSIALLNRFPTPDTPYLTQCAVQTIKDAQAVGGGWPTARLISSEGRHLLHVASYEVALTLTHLLIRKLYSNDIPFCLMVYPTLERAFALVRSSFDIVGDDTVGEISGWANDHNRRTGLIESWSTAIVFGFLTHYRDALIHLRQRLILEKYDVKYVDDPVQVKKWPDMTPAFRRQDQVDPKKIDDISDPTDNAELSTAIKDKVVNPISQSWIHRPQTVSLILHGDPGTRKTTLVTKIAEALKWPLVTLSPSFFLRNGGLEGFDARAEEIFNDLMRLRRVVVILDECEDFFKPRPEHPQLENRTIGAFMTPGMLPRLQSLHNKRWIIFVLATNSKIAELDEAAIRSGRFDHAMEIMHPTLDAQKRYVDKKVESNDFVISRSAVTSIKAALQQYAHNRGIDTDAPHVSFSHLDTLLSTLAGTSRPKVEGVVHTLKHLLQQKGPPSLI